MPARPPNRRTPRAPATIMLSGLDNRAWLLAVYASWRGSPHAARKTRFRLLAKLYRVGLVTHRVATKGFSDARASRPPFPSLPGATFTYFKPERGQDSREEDTHLDQ